MRTSALISLLFISAAAVAKPVFIEPAHDMTTPAHAQDVSSNGAGNRLILDRNTGGDARSGLISYKSPGDIPDHATNRIAQLHHPFWTDPPAMAGGLLRITATWCEGGSHPASENHDGAAVQANPAMWVRTNRSDGSWVTADRYSPGLSSSMEGSSAIGRNTYGWSNRPAADITDWIDNPEAKSGWMLRVSKGMTAVKRFHDRHSLDAVDSPVLDVEYSVTWSATDTSGLRYEPDLTGVGYNVYKTPLGWLIHLFSHSTPGEFLWVTADPVTLDESIFDRMIGYPMLIGVPGTLDSQAAQAEPQPYGSLGAIFDKRTLDGFALDGLDGDQATNLVMLVGIENSLCQ